MLLKSLRMAALIAGTTLVSPVVLAQAVLQSGDVRLGVRADGALNVADPAALDPGYGATGITFVPSGRDALTPGCWCEAWGVADQVSSRFGSAGAETGTQNIVVESFTSTATTATSVTRVVDGTGALFRVTHAFAPASAALYRVNVTIENISGAPATVLYRRAMDWDVYPQRFSEMSTINMGSSPKIVFASDDGFANGNPLSGPSSLSFTGNATDNGPADHGALFDFNFGSVAPGAKVTFSIFYGAAANELAAMAALSAIGAEAYSLGKPNPDAPGAAADGSPNTYIFAFAGIGGAPIAGGNVEAVPVNAPIALGLLSAAISMAGLLGTRRKRRPGGRGSL
ncbi:hypothetical protein [Ottowia testudinis]|uniref:PEP-CTERM sorting domain-containing protein n=1 Tax=Ottowia testudinis TaxID=2816950 RepID=A0A975CH11_9BURK|nr:hypothetical protein [Ottowia testudinis]QTD45627.1 hypothetical protein J1M35_01500 [Ottowia testudinis]